MMSPFGFSDDRPWSSLVALLRQRAEQSINHEGFSFLGEQPNQLETLNYATLDRQARALASHLQELNAKGQRVLLLFRPGLAYITAFFGCLYAGAIAVPAYPPASNRPTPRLQAIVTDSQARIVLTTSKFMPSFAYMPELAALDCLTLDTLTLNDPSAWHDPMITADSLAFLQYTSGSTATPKGVMLSHANLLHNLGLIKHAFGHSEASNGVIWLPPYHDMGLIGGILQPLYANFPVTLMAPVSFLQQPLRWLQTISDNQATTSGGPNFAYDLCVRKITPEQRSELDLSSWQVAFNGAEPIRAETLTRFSDYFGICGFNARAFYPCYGLAEATLMVTGVARDSLIESHTFDPIALDQHVVQTTATETARSMVGSGAALGQQQVIIVEPTTQQACASDQVGEVWVAGPSVAHGYWNRPEQSEQTFNAYTTTGQGPFLRTGDLGFLHQGQLFITGRLKDLIIVRGRNVYPQDLELTAERSHPALRENGGAAFAIELDGNERLVLVHEINRVDRKVDPNVVINAIRAALIEQHELAPYAIGLIHEGYLPRTSSGKIQRHAARHAWLNQEFKLLGQSIPEQDHADHVPDPAQIEQLLQTIQAATSPEQAELLQQYVQLRLAQTVRIDPARIDPTQHIARLGIDSLMAVELKQQLEHDLHCQLPMMLFLEAEQVGDIVTAIQASFQSANQPQHQQLEPLIVSANQPYSWPASYGQQALWFLQQRTPTSAAYNLSSAFKIHGPLNICLFEQAVQLLVERHAALRTRLEQRAGSLYQVVYPAEFETADFHVLEQQPEYELAQAWLQQAALAPFDLANDRLFRVRIIKQSTTLSLAMLSLHHSIADFWSLQILLRELMTLYSSLATNQPSQLATSIDYDYVKLQQHFVASSAGQQQRQFWQHQLGDQLPVLNLPSDQTRLPHTIAASQQFRFKLSLAQSQTLKQFAKTHAVTPYMVLLASFKLLLHHYTGDNDLIVGSPTAGRTQRQLEQAVGYFVNPISLRSTIRRTQSFAEFVQTIRQTSLAAFNHQDYPFNLLVEQLQPDRQSHSPIFQTMFTLETARMHTESQLSALIFGVPEARLALHDVVLEPYSLDSQHAQFDLVLRMLELPDGFAGVWEYATDRLSEATIQQLQRHFSALLTACLAQPDQPLAHGAILNHAEQTAIQAQATGAKQPHQQQRLVHEAVEFWAHQQPHSIAIHHAEDWLSYQMLNQQANHMAHWLIAQGIQPEMRVALYLDRSINLIISMLAILKAGASYVPIDPTYPQERVEFILADANVRLVITDQRLRDQFNHHELACLVVDQDHWQAQPHHNPGLLIDPHQLAYVIYTSGSTGQPKGVAVEHQSLCNLIAWHQSAFQITPHDRATLLASIAFDASVWETWPYLSSGAALVIVADSLRTDAHQLHQWLLAEQITISFMPTPLAEQLVQFEWPRQTALRWLLTGGDTLQLYPSAALPFQLVNNYGPTENTVVSTSGSVWADATTHKRPSIGRPISNSQAFVLDQALNFVPQGVVGELYLGGSSLARGYLNQPGKTAEAFIPNPWGEERGSRLYRTGDLARYNLQGQLEFVGRRDVQVKIRGFRIELGEIEAQLHQYPSIQQAIVLVDQATTKRLIAFVVSQAKSTVDQQSLQQWLKQRLPAYMIPARIIELDSMPITSNGKIDQRQLHRLIPLEQAPLTPLANPIEQQIAQIWQELLQTNELGRESHFFELGGHSLLATQVLARLRAQINQAIPLALLFEAPTIGELALRLDQMAQPNQLALPRLAAQPRPKRLPLASAQQRLWLIDQIDTATAAYTVPAAVRFSGQLNQQALTYALNGIIQRHEILRTNFVSDADGSYQIIHQERSLSPEYIDLQRLTQAEQAATIYQRFLQVGNQPFDLAHDLLIRAQLIQTAEAEYVLLVVLHHIVCDGWSIGVLIDELRSLYTNYVNNQPMAKAELQLHYADFALWQAQVLDQGYLAPALAYWQHQLANAPSLLELPTDYPRSPTQQFQGAQIAIPTLQALTPHLHELAKTQDATLFMVLMAGLNLLLHRLSNQADLVIGTPIANRQDAALESLIGCFVNTLAIRTNLDPQQSFNQLLANIRHTMLEAYTHQDLPFERVVESLQLERSLSYTPVFQVLCVLQNTPPRSLTLPDVGVEILDWHNQTAKFDLTFTLEETKTGLKGWIEYNTSLFDASTIQRMAEHFVAILHAVVQQPTQPLSKLVTLPKPELQRLLHTWNATDYHYQHDQGLHTAIAQQAQRTPHAIAVLDGSDALSYHDLEQQANQLAHYLLSQGVQPEQRIGVCVQRNRDLLICLLAILKVGAAYLPLDPTYPLSRLQLMVDDAQAQLVLTHAAVQATVALENCHMLVLEQLEAHGGRLPTTAPAVQINATQLAYLIYTSGSTGKPKGVAISHANAVALIEWAKTQFSSAELAGVLAATSICFDLSIFELFLPLSVGGTVILAQNALDLINLPAAHHVSLINTVPSALAELVRQHAIPTSVMTINLAGEPLPQALAQEIYAETQVERLYNLYGPSEDTTYSTYALIAADGVQAPAIGRPIANTQAYVLDRYQQPVAQGVVGELYLGGAGVARGYLNRPDLTAEKFVPNPWSIQAGARLYRTGDLVRYRTNGELEFLGRVDHQVKVRGFRIELGEIEACLRHQPSIDECVVIVDQAPSGPQLVAYCATNSGNLSEQMLRQRLAEQLPDYMLPAVIMLLPALPHTANGKIDRKALPKSVNPLWIADHFVAPQHPFEEMVVNTMSQVLGLGQLSVDANFFSMGGHSLLATQVIGRLRSMLNRDVPLRLIFEAPTATALAARIMAIQAHQEEPEIQALSRAQAYFPLSFAQERLWFLHQLAPHNSSYIIPMAVRLVGSLNQAALQASLNALVARHEGLRTIFVLDNDQPAQGILPYSALELQNYDIQAVAPDAQRAACEQIVAELQQAPFDLSTGPLLRCGLVRLKPDEHFFVLIMHHIISDAWSMSVFVREAMQLYQAYCQDHSAMLQPLPIQYADVASWQRNWLRGSVLDQQLAYWRQQLANLSTLNLPTDYPRPALQTTNGRSLAIELDQNLTQALQTLSREAGATLFMSLLAAFKIVLARYSGQRDICVGSPIANRNRPATEDLIGFFVNTLVLRSDIDEHLSFAQLLTNIRATTLDAYAHQDTPFEKLVEVLQPQRDLSRNPLFQVMFVLHNTPASLSNLEHLRLERVDFAQTTAQFDLTLALEETANGLVGYWEYNTDLFAPTTIERLSQHFKHLVLAIVANATTPIKYLDLLSHDEQQQLLYTWNHQHSIKPSEHNVHSLFEAQVAQNSQAIAVIDAQSRLSYAQLNQRANQLAHCLRAQGLQPDSFVGVCMLRSVDLVVALLAILKAGAAYVPLDPAYPAERLAYIITDTKLSVVLSQREVVAALPDQQTQLNVICVDRDLGDQYPTTNLELMISPDQLAYMIYTSGSTGQPKGVMISHSAISQRLQWMQHAYHVVPSDRLLQKTSLNFDVSVWEIFTPLITGAQLIMAKPDGHHDSEYLLQTIREHQITLIDFVPSMLELFLAEPNAKECTSLRQVTCGGEAMTPQLRARFFATLTAELHNIYGPTETTIDATMAACHPNQREQRITIGRPIGGSEAYILDQLGRPVAIGVVGELYLGGVGLARGYFERPSQTAQAFVPHPWSSVAGARLYRTGDLARYLADGSIEFLGRRDQQIKLRGLRIELGEIEAALRHHPAVREAVVIVQNHSQLIGYVALQPAMHVDGSELRAFLKPTLPDYMLPNGIVVLERLPSLPNGKLDLAALPQPQTLRMSNTEFVAARTSTEQQLVAIWQELLELEQLGVHDNFFELGGHSLLSTQAVSRIRNRFGVELALRTFFEQPTIAELALWLDRHASPSKNKPKIQARPRAQRQLEQTIAQIEQLSEREVSQILEEKKFTQQGSIND
ncbi:amino acid adenylation domain-containing protein [Herpetosiphon sp. NSE202]|uniref:amino acid adenylation domain-containing protein n=1 Tax=Herpetosiphon sp. NSE202 TaxID=3351349 RepID=UPI0036359102